MTDIEEICLVLNFKHISKECIKAASSAIFCCSIVFKWKLTEKKSRHINRNITLSVQDGSLFYMATTVAFRSLDKFELVSSQQHRIHSRYPPLVFIIAELGSGMESR